MLFLTVFQCVGSLSDPWDIPGLAHFCEHMLFMGTSKYADENDYSKYLSEHSGGSNAYTAGDHTNYFFDVSPDALTGALDRCDVMNTLIFFFSFLNVSTAIYLLFIYIYFNCP